MAKTKKKTQRTKSTSSKKSPMVAILMGSDSDQEVMRGAADALKSLKVPYEARVLSAHRTPKEAAEYAQTARRRGIRVFICGAGGAAHLAGAIAGSTELPVIGVPVSYGALKGHDALLATVQMPPGVPVATVAIDGSRNAGILAAQMIAFGGEKQDQDLMDRIVAFKAEQRAKVLKKKLSI